MYLQTAMVRCENDVNLILDPISSPLHLEIDIICEVQLQITGVYSSHGRDHETRSVWPTGLLADMWKEQISMGSGLQRGGGDVVLLLPFVAYFAYKRSPRIPTFCNSAYWPTGQLAHWRTDPLHWRPSLSLSPTIRSEIQIT